DNLIDKFANGFADWVMGNKSGGGGLAGALGASSTSIASKMMASTSVSSNSLAANDNTPSLGLAGSALGFVG
ncbi:MAG: hypothetical protein J7516_17335, partial [Shinella sp.]|nr:hypothetical protein [Shinella sp.]